jgi:hypothetical protein
MHTEIALSRPSPLGGEGLSFVPSPFQGEGWGEGGCENYFATANSGCHNWQNKELAQISYADSLITG